MSTPEQEQTGGRPLARFRLLGFPIHVDWTFLLVVGVFGYRPGVTLTELAVWLVVAFLAVLLHELGHAVTARRTGARPAIALVMFGGVTTYAPPRPLSRLTSLGISLAGPAVGLALGGVLLLVGRTVDLEPGGLAEYTLVVAIFTTLGWSVLNLLPIVPLDGGQAMRELLPGSPEVRARRASIISIVLAVGLAFLALTGQFVGQFAAVYAVLLILINVAALRSSGPGDAAGAGGGPDDGAVRLLWEGRPEDARALLENVPPGGRPDLALHGAVLATTGQREQGFALLQQEWARRPGDGHVVALLALAHLLLGEYRDIGRLLTGPSASAVPPPIVARAIAGARAAGDETTAVELERAASAARPGEDAGRTPPLG